jgi:hypothetical protein
MFQQTSAVAGRRVLAISDNAQISSLPITSGLAAPGSPPVWLELLATLQPGTQSDRAGVEFTRRLCLHNRYFGFLETVMEAVEAQFADWTKPNDILRRFCAIT